jgi:ADP-ribose pyrophosphatase YjhB (NUDIX family)
MRPVIKIKAFALIRRDAEILVEEVLEEGVVKGYRPLGGTVEFGELSQNTLKREFIEELNAEILVGDLVCVSEEVFEYNGMPGHEQAFIYEASFVDESLYQENEITRIDTVHGMTVKAIWINPDAVSDDTPLFPSDLRRELKRNS